MQKLKGLFAQFATNPDLEKTGVWVEYPVEGVEEDKYPAFLLARAGGANTRFIKRMEAETKPYRRQIQTETIARAKIHEITVKVYCETVILGWRNVEDEDGQPIDHSTPNAVAYFSKLPELFADLESQAGKATLYKMEMSEAALGN